jgi:hypothetical protein
LSSGSTGSRRSSRRPSTDGTPAGWSGPSRSPRSGATARCPPPAGIRVRSPGSGSRSSRGQFDAGLIEEAVRLRERFDPGLPAFSAIGYREAWAVVDGRLGREAAIAENAARNVAFAKRQRTWFRSERDIAWLDVTRGDPHLASLELARAAVPG